MIGHFDDPDALEAWVADIKKRKGNLPVEVQQAEIGSAIEARWEEITADLAHYKRGGFLLEGGAPFNTLSLGNWIVLAEAAGVPFVPVHYLGSLSIIDYLRSTRVDGNAPAGELPDELKAKMDLEVIFEDHPPSSPAGAVDAVNDALSKLEGAWFVRSDGTAPSSAKNITYRGCNAAEEGRETGFGYDTLPDGRREVHLADRRIGKDLMGWPEPDAPFWARPIMPARMISTPEGDYQAEWRIYVYNGRIQAVSTYYPQAPRNAESQEDHLGLMLSLTYALAILDKVQTLELRPHHPRFELRENFDKSVEHFTLDFIETEGHSVMLLEGGPPHLREPAYGAHFCAFSQLRDDGQYWPLPEMPSGIAWGGGVFSTAEELDDMLIRVRAYLQSLVEPDDDPSP